ncbi:hypothetical protein CYQ88_01050 [Hydrogenovibrio sp. SC-1]|uniref:ExeA family protein n=1 Tax=Hydrogenovibrio sp. SC-1 TaxID=2065820 RepID=UPI000C7D79C6|nr:AAA family ATPase [Hydrogenovibrio sp. SC-1]PLA75583.1 hypothetical protein CYQ88_01050 [Hydrogenovibrio sp. SC-1]
MYCSFFGLKKLPFKISPDLSFFYSQAARDDIVHALLYSIGRGDGIIKVIGEVGVGKTTILRLLAEKLPESYRKIYISSPNLSSMDFLKFICTDLKIEVKSSDTKLDLMGRLNQFLLTEYAQNRLVVMLVDEAQAMTLDTLEEVRLLGNLETGEDKLLQIVLFGQPELDVTLNDPRVKPLKDRIACSVEIPALKAEEVMQYLNYRMRVAGYMGQDLFTLKLARRIQQLTRGLPRSINLLADKLLMVAFSKGDNKIKLQHFKTLLPEYDVPKTVSELQWFRRLALIALIVGIGGFAVFQYAGQHSVDMSLLSGVEPTLAKTEAFSNSKSLRPTDLAKVLDVEISQLWQMASLQEKTEAFLTTLDSQEAFIVMSPMPIVSFAELYYQVANRLSAPNQQYLFALFEIDLKQKVYQYQLIYYPRESTAPELESKRQDLVAISQFEYWQVKPLETLQVKMQALQQSGKRL